MKRVLIVVVVVFLGLVLTWVQKSHGASKQPVVQIGTVADGPSKRLSNIGRLIQKEILELTRGEFDVRFPDKKQLDGSWSMPGIHGTVENLLADPKIDLIIALGVIASNDLAQRKRLRKPVIAPFVIDAKLQGLPLKKGSSGVKNLNYLDSFRSSERDVKAFTEILPFTKLTLLVDKLFLDAFPLLRGKIRRIAADNNITITAVTVGTSIKPALDALPADTEAVLVTALLRIPSSEFDLLVSALIARRLPSFSLFGREGVERGLLASVAPKEDDQRLARRVALNVQRVLLGEDPGKLSVTFPTGERLTINMATVRAIDKWPSFTVLTEAELLKEAPEKAGRRLSLYTAVREGVSVNLDLAAADRKVAAGLGQVYRARAGLLPQIGIGVTASQIKKELAEGNLPLSERGVTWEGEARQLLYSDDAWANYTVEKRRQKSREEDRRRLRLDIVQNVAVAYLDVLRSKTTEQIQKDNLSLTRTNLELARVRVAVGQARRDEVFRWEAEIARSRIDVLHAQAARRQSKVALNRLLYRPLNEPFTTAEAGLDDSLLLIGKKRLFRYVNNPRNFGIFLDFQVQEGLNASPELRRTDALIAAQERKVLNAQRSYWLPEASLTAKAFQQFAQDGAIGGGGTGTFIPGFGNVTTDSGGVEGPIYAFQLGLSFPLFEGGGKDATQVRESEDLRRLRLEREATVGRIEERIRFALYQAGASFPSIRLAREAADAARKNYTLVAEQYKRGEVDIIKSTDAQTLDLNQNLEAANAVYDFLIDLARVQRAVGRFDYFMYADERAAWFGRLEAFFARAGVVPNTR